MTREPTSQPSERRIRRTGSRWHNRLVSNAGVSVPSWTPAARELDDVDLLVNGCFEPPLAGFVDPTDAGAAASVTLVVSEETAELAAVVGQLDLVDPEGAPLARLTVTDTWEAGGGRRGLVGPVERLAANQFGPFRRLHLAPADVHEKYDAATLLAVPVTRALTDDDLAAIRATAAGQSLTPLLLPCTGDGMPVGLSAPALVRATLEAAALLESDAQVVAVSAADRGGDVQDRDEANSWLLDSVARAFAGHVLHLDVEPNGNLPETVEGIVARDRPTRDHQGLVIFFTGLSGSGKSTLARALIDYLLEQGERTVTSLDGDVVRHLLSKGLGFSREDRETNIVRIGFVAAEISRHGGVAVCSPIAPFDSTRQEVRKMVERAGGGFVLVHVATPLEECERRDRKGLYAKARAGGIPDFTGISSPYEEPHDAIKVDTTGTDIAVTLDELLSALAADGWLPSRPSEA
jgi:sulfate adenylyltransferase